MYTALRLGILWGMAIWPWDVFGDVVPSPSSAKSATQVLGDAVSLTPRAHFHVSDLLKKIQDYFNSYRTLRATVQQEDPDGTIRTGLLEIQRPGKMRLTYKAPTRVVMISDGEWLSYDDPTLDQVSYVPLSSTPASFVLKDSLDLSQVHVERVERVSGMVHITLRDPGSPEMGSLTLVFQEKPLKFSGWEIVDATTQTTVVELKDLKTGVDIAPEQFEFDAPHDVG